MHGYDRHRINLLIPNFFAMVDPLKKKRECSPAELLDREPHSQY